MVALETPAQRRTLISIVIPCLNEADNVERAYLAVSELFATRLPQYDLEILFLDNHSSDNTYPLVLKIAERDQRVKVVRYSRNFGFNRSLLTGYRLASGKAAIQFDCDLQDPPEMFVKFLEHWENGHDVVVGERRKRQEGHLLQWARRRFYRMLAAVSDDNLAIDGGDFRLIDRSVMDNLQWIDDVNPYVRGLTSLLARNQIGVPYDRRTRSAGASKFPLRRLFGLAIGAFVSHSTLPLKVASYFGVAIAVLTALAATGYTMGYLMFGLNWPAGFTTQVVLILAGISINAIFLGVLGEYVARIHTQLKLRPLTLIMHHRNFEPEQLRRATRQAPPFGSPIDWGIGREATACSCTLPAAGDEALNRNRSDG